VLELRLAEYSSGGILLAISSALRYLRGRVDGKAHHDRMTIERIVLTGRCYVVVVICLDTLGAPKRVMGTGSYI
jgi:hypothetical protein